MITLTDEYRVKLQGVTFIDLFAGIGGFHLALNSFGANCLFSSEWDKYAQQTYKQNFTLSPSGDITKIASEDIPKHDFLCAGFPCQPFSVSGNQQGFEDTRGTLFYDIIRLVTHHQPKVLILENVKNLKNHDNGKTLKTIINELKKANYSVFYKILNTSMFGLPQNRERIFFVCFHNSLSIKKFSFPDPLLEQTALSDILEQNPDAKIVERDDIVITKTIPHEKDIFGNTVKYNRPIQVGIVNKGGQGERIYHPSGHSITLSANGGGVGAKTGLYLINEQIRKLSIRECARLQGFPDSYQFPCSKSQSYKQLGNSVSVNVLQIIIKEIIDQGVYMNEKQLRGSKTAKDGFHNEYIICDKFNSWKEDNEAQQWLKIMGYSLNNIEKITAVQIPVRIKKADYDKYNITPEDYAETTKYKKADAQIKLLIKIGSIWKVENISIKKANSNSNYNQIDKRPVATYKAMWGFNDLIEKWLNLFTGEIIHSDLPTLSTNTFKNKKRIFFTEMPDEVSNEIILFFEANRIKIVCDILKGRGGLAAEWLLVTKLDNISGTNSWVLKDMNSVMNFFGQGEVKISPRGSLSIGRITMQRKGGTPDPTSLQFKIHPCDLFSM